MHTGQFKPGQSGNPAGRAVGCRNRKTVLIESIFERGASEVAETVLKMALKGDQAATRIVMSRLAPARRDRTISFAFPTVETIDDAIEAGKIIIAAVANEEMTPAEATELTRLVEAQARLLGWGQLDERVKRLEEEHDAPAAQSDRPGQPS